MTDISGSNTVSDGYNQPYTPTTEEVWRAYINYEYGGPGQEFDRWLAEVKAEAWEQGHNAKWVGTYFEDNPYRQGETE